MRFPEDQHPNTTQVHRAQNEPLPEQQDTRMSDFVEQTAPTLPLTPPTLEEVKQAFQSGQRQHASRLSKEVAQREPNNAEAWLYCAALTDNEMERLSYLNKALSLAPEYVNARLGMYETLKLYLERDPFLRYLEETEGLYHALTGEGQVVIVPKDRAVSPPYPAPERTSLERAFRWLTYSLLGLPLAGLVTLVCAPVAVAFALRAGEQRLNRHRRRRANAALVYASILWMIGFVLGFLFLLHVIM